MPHVPPPKLLTNKQWNCSTSNSSRSALLLSLTPAWILHKLNSISSTGGCVPENTIVWFLVTLKHPPPPPSFFTTSEVQEKRQEKSFADGYESKRTKSWWLSWLFDLIPNTFCTHLKQSESNTSSRSIISPSASPACKADTHFRQRKDEDTFRRAAWRTVWIIKRQATLIWRTHLVLWG